MGDFREKAETFVMRSLGYVLGGVFIVSGFGLLTQSFLTAAIAILLGVTLIPRVPLPGWGRGLGVVVLFLLLGVSAGRQASRDAAIEREATAEVEARKQAEDLARFQEMKDSLLGAMQEALAAGDPLRALQMGVPYRAVGDPELSALMSSAEELKTAKEAKDREAALVAQVREVPASDLQENRRLYAELATLRPDVARYQERRDHYSRQIEAAQQAAAERRAKFGSPPERSAWDGTYRVVRDYLRDIANDPSSIDMIACTDVFHVDSGWLVGCDYRGKNAFGGLIRASNWFIIRHDRVVRMEDASAYRNR